MLVPVATVSYLISYPLLLIIASATINNILADKGDVPSSQASIWDLVAHFEGGVEPSLSLHCILLVLVLVVVEDWGGKGKYRYIE